MSELTKVLLNIRSLRAFGRELTLEQLEEALEKLTVVTQERRDQEAEMAAENQARAAKLQEYAEMLQADGIDINELVATVTSTGVKAAKSKRDPRPAKYKYMSGNVEKTWTGQGRTPSAIQKALDAGESLESFEI
ncbi:H-NS family nucleoid-associated regulatory protein [Vibrio barjaei]|uniref:H-NS family histone-like protein n=1 Tax=Vibrio barjaei TaxID=1676683 RepID=UPI0022846C83|nr:H-NS family nucleoid-associated regulatory protein [Vibrio barjaei]MCY9870501.1 H-NS family nucleoid-associated regulatory protein [Vibrio barjaei]